jgi:probable phosphoglycerate mutase
MKFYLARHGETTSDIEGRYGGDYDDHLTAKGIEESKELAKKLSRKGIEAVYYSSRARADETAKIVISELKVPSSSMDNFKERNNYGVLTGLTKAEALEKFPNEVKKLEADSKNHLVAGSESYAHFKERVLRAFGAVANEEHKTVAIITHSGPIRVILRELAKKELASIDDCAIIEIEEADGAVKIISAENAELQNR